LKLVIPYVYYGYGTNNFYGLEKIMAYKECDTTIGADIPVWLNDKLDKSVIRPKKDAVAAALVFYLDLTKEDQLTLIERLPKYGSGEASPLLDILDSRIEALKKHAERHRSALNATNKELPAD
jgi:hypothetical protein